MCRRQTPAQAHQQGRWRLTCLGEERDPAKATQDGKLRRSRGSGKPQGGPQLEHIPGPSALTPDHTVPEKVAALVQPQGMELDQEMRLHQDGGGASMLTFRTISWVSHRFKEKKGKNEQILKESLEKSGTE